jgi:hypothetical protein
MDESDKLRNVIAVLRQQLQAIQKERQVILALLEEMEETLEAVSSEIPIQSPKRQRIEQWLVRVRAALAEYREALLQIQSNSSPEKA